MRGGAFHPLRLAHGRPCRLLIAGVLLGLVFLSPARAADPDTGRDVEPAPPWIFFPEPDPVTAREIHKVIGWFADPNHTVNAREALVRRFGLISVPQLVQVLAEHSNESYTWNAALTSYAIRDTFGNARESWPLVPPLVRLLEESAEPYRRAFAALALGSFHGPSFAPDPPEHPDPLIVRPPEVEYRNSLDRAVAALGSRVDDPNQQVRVAVALALGKSGTPAARRLLRAPDRLAHDAETAEKTVEARMAVLLAIGLLPGQADEDLLLGALADEERKIRRAAALAVALQALHDHPPPWIREPRPLIRALEADPIRLHLEDGAEAVFARGVLASLGVAGAREWRDLYALATHPPTEETTVRAAAQCLLFCREPWFPKKVLQRIREGADLQATTVAAFLLLLGTSATPEGIQVCRDYLGNPGLRPKGKPDWDVRFFAAVGLLRALASGDVTDPKLRLAVLQTLDTGLKRGLKDGPFKRALNKLMERERQRVAANPHYAIPEKWILQVERAFRDPHGLLARDLRDVAVVRLNDMVPLVFSVLSLKPGLPGDRTTEGIPRRFLADCHDRFPYFTRLDLKADRGRRSVSEMKPAVDPTEEVRR